jgi:DNA-directed RNA polymerase subunit RPC12/RpoP
MESNTQLSVNLEHTTPYTCDKCGCEFFEEIVCIRKISKLLSGSLEDGLIPMKTYRCSDCKHINDDFNIDK